jgi:TBC1 domain family protein 5
MSCIVIDANYSLALMLLLKYPAPDAEHGPQTFVDDAIYLRDNFSALGGAKIISKYSGRSPSLETSDSRPVTPLGQALSPKKQFGRTRSPLPSPARFLQQQGGIEGLFQGATKGVFERGERLGINQAVRDAVGEVKKNMQGLQASRNSPAGRRTSDVLRWSLDEGKQVPASRASISAINRRNKQLAQMLEHAMADLRAVSIAAEADKETCIKAMDIAIAKVDFVKVYLDDATIPLPEVSTQAESPMPPTPVPPRPTATPSTSPDAAADLPTSDSQAHPPIMQPSVKPLAASAIPRTTAGIGAIEPDGLSEDAVNNSDVPAASPVAQAIDQGSRPKGPVPTRSTIAQSSFSWMLEPDTGSGSSLKPLPPKSTSPFLISSRKATSGPKRDKAAFLFGEEAGEPSSARLGGLIDTEDAFNLGAMKGSEAR